MGLAASVTTPTNAPSEGQLEEGSAQSVPNPSPVAENDAHFSDGESVIGTPTFAAPRVAEETASQVEAIGTVTPPAVTSETEEESTSLASVVDGRLKQGGQPASVASGNKANMTGVKSPEAILNASLQKQIESLHAQIQTLMLQIGAEKKQAEKAVLDATIGVQNDIAKLRTVLHSKDEEILNHRAHIAELDQEVVTLKKQIENLRLALQEADALVAGHSNVRFLYTNTLAENIDGSLDVTTQQKIYPIIATLLSREEELRSSLNDAKNSINKLFNELVEGKVVELRTDSVVNNRASAANEAVVNKLQEEAGTPTNNDPNKEENVIASREEAGAEQVIDSNTKQDVEEVMSASIQELQAEGAPQETTLPKAAVTTQSAEAVASTPQSQTAVAAETIAIASKQAEPIMESEGSKPEQAEAVTNETNLQEAKAGGATEQYVISKTEGSISTRISEVAPRMNVSVQVAQETLRNFNAGGNDTHTLREVLGSPFGVDSQVDLGVLSDPMRISLATRQIQEIKS